MFEIKRETSVPLYIQLAQSIEERIQEGIFRPGSKIPSETELMKDYSVSRITVRQAMKYLSERNLIVRRRGLGSFVRGADVRQTVEELFGIYQSLIKFEPDLTMELLKYEEVPANQEVRENLQIQKHE
jgi:DNA-binding GntR family transcriptional regulator